MRIDAFTCCAGTKYAALLEKSIARWTTGVATLTIATDTDTNFGPAVTAFEKANQLRIVHTNSFKLYGAHFNKAAALNDAWAHMPCATEWVLHFDSDITPPLDWFKQLENREDGHDAHTKLFGTRRYSEDGKRLDEANFWAYGFFQMWHAQSPACWRWPLFDNHHAHAGNYDADFAERWSRSHWVDLGIPVTHPLEPRHDWFGPDGTPEQMADLKTGHRHLYDVRVAARRPENQLKLPTPTATINLRDPSWGMWQEVLRFAKSMGQWQCRVTTDRG
jgi:hypothetical protein